MSIHQPYTTVRAYHSADKKTTRRLRQWQWKWYVNYKHDNKGIFSQ